MYIVSRNIAGNAIEYAYGANGNVTYGNNRNHANYYAYGLPVQESEVKDPDPYLYSGKEFYSLRSVNIYDFGARTYAPDIARFCRPGTVLLALVKPQFESRRGEAEGGVVRDEAVRMRTVDEVQCALRENGFTTNGPIRSPLRGPSGNIEYLLRAEYVGNRE